MVSKPVVLAEIVRMGQQIVLPEGMGYPTAIDVLNRQMTYEEEQTKISEVFDGFVWDAAYAFTKAMTNLFGFPMQEAKVHEFFGMKMKELPELRTIEIGPDGETALIPWGQFSLPNVEGKLETQVVGKKERVCFAVVAEVKRKDEGRLRVLLAETHRLLKTESIYKGKAFKLRLRDDDGVIVSLPMPTFISLSKVRPDELIFSDEVREAIETSVFTPIEHVAECRLHKIPLKRGILFYGPYGTGKSLTANVTAKKCTESGWTFLYCERASELGDMVKLAHDYQPAVVFCEDIDRVVSGERSVEMDEILNIIDGIEAKGTELMVILTTNHVESINKALLRPGRLDAVINVLPPDAKAVEKLLRIYGRGLIPENADLHSVSEVLAGTIPAVIRECAERAKLSQIKLGVETSDGKGKHMVLTPAALLDASQGMKNQLDLLQVSEIKETAPERLAGALQQIVRDSHNGDLQEIKDGIQEVRDNM